MKFKFFNKIKIIKSEDPVVIRNITIISRIFVFVNICY